MLRSLTDHNVSRECLAVNVGHCRIGWILYNCGQKIIRCQFLTHIEAHERIAVSTLTQLSILVPRTILQGDPGPAGSVASRLSSAWTSTRWHKICSCNVVVSVRTKPNQDGEEKQAIEGKETHPFTTKLLQRIKIRLEPDFARRVHLSIPSILDTSVLEEITTPLLDEPMRVGCEMHGRTDLLDLFAGLDDLLPAG